MKLMVYGTENEAKELMYLIQQRTAEPPFDTSVLANVPQWIEIDGVDEYIKMKRTKREVAKRKADCNKKFYDALRKYGGGALLAHVIGISIDEMRTYEMNRAYGRKPDVPLMQRMAKELKLTLDDVAAAFYGPAE